MALMETAMNPVLVLRSLFLATVTVPSTSCATSPPGSTTGLAMASRLGTAWLMLCCNH